VWERRRAELMAQLKNKVFRWFPAERVPFDTKVSRNTGGWTGRYADYKEVSFQTEEGVRVRAQLLTPKAGLSNPPLLIYVKRMADSFFFMDMDELLPLLSQYAVLILNPRFTESPLNAAEHANIERTALWTGRTIGAMQVWDILRAIQWAVEEGKLSGSSISLYGKGEMGILALYAALFEGSIQQVILNGSPASHWKGPGLLNVLRVTDIPEVAGMLAPRRLISLTKFQEGFDYSKRIYGLQRASRQFIESGSLPEALEVWKPSSARR
jgi:hypothetical protein